MSYTQLYKVLSFDEYEILGKVYRRSELPLLEAAQDLHMRVTAAADISPVRALLLYAYIKARLSTWIAGPSRCAKYDSIVFQLLTEAVDEYESTGCLDEDVQR